MMREQRQQVDSWQQQNEKDQRADMQQLEGLMLQVGPYAVLSSRTSPSPTHRLAMRQPALQLRYIAAPMRQFMLVHKPCMCAVAVIGRQGRASEHMQNDSSGCLCCGSCSMKPSCRLWHVTPVAVTVSCHNMCVWSDRTIHALLDGECDLGSGPGGSKRPAAHMHTWCPHREHQLSRRAATQWLQCSLPHRAQ
jgi:hypothetical protein